MSPRRRLFSFLESLAIPNITLYLIFGQVAMLGAEMVARLSLDPIVLVPALVLEGEWWRLFSYLLLPPSSHPVFMAFAWYLFYLMGSALEAHWGVARYNLFLLTGWALTTAVAFITPLQPTTNAFLAGSVFLSFAYLAPNFELALFFILPVKIKWLALITWIGYAFAAVTGDWRIRLAVLAATGNFLLFFGRDILLTMSTHRRRMSHQARHRLAAAEKSEPRHRCVVCGKDSDTHPEMDFRYCSKCAGEQCYCPDHIRNHEHVVPAENPPA